LELDVRPPLARRRLTAALGGGLLRIDVPGSLALDEPDMMAQASRAGLGLAYVDEWMVADDIASGRLLVVLSEWTPSYPGYCLYYPGRRHMAATLRAFVDLAQEIVFRNRAKAS
jgi:DNA-binding transcriptional LysR family regulator